MVNKRLSLSHTLITMSQEALMEWVAHLWYRAQTDCLKSHCNSLYLIYTTSMRIPSIETATSNSSSHLTFKTTARIQARSFKSNTWTTKVLTTGRIRFSTLPLNLIDMMRTSRMMATLPWTLSKLKSLLRWGTLTTGITLLTLMTYLLEGVDQRLSRNCLKRT